MLKLEELVFRQDEREGGTVIEYLVDGRKKTHTVPRMVGEVLEAVVSAEALAIDRFLDLNRRLMRVEEELKNERPSGLDGRSKGGPVIVVRRKPRRKEEETSSEA